jgi:ubiquinone/menaquinone biosynthesis C-methylase UbiE
VQESSVNDSKPRRFYNIGAGSFHHPEWVNVDLVSDYYSVLQPPGFIAYDLMRLEPLPIETGGAELVYCSHTLEHVTNEAAANMLRESHRVLQPGGVLRLVVPCAEIIWRAYQNNDLSFFFMLAKASNAVTALEAFMDMFGSQLCQNNVATCGKWNDEHIASVLAGKQRDEALEYIASQVRFNPEHPASHVNWYTPEKLIGMVRAAGFSNVYRSGVGQSSRIEMRDVRKFDPHPWYSLYVEAVK